MRLLCLSMASGKRAQFHNLSDISRRISATKFPLKTQKYLYSLFRSMGASRSSFQRKGSSAPYNIYVTNKTDGIKHLYVRLRDDKLGDTETYRRLTGSRPTGTAERSLQKQRKEKLFPTLTQAGFCLLQPGIPKRFSVMSRASSPMYVSVHDGYDLWVTDMLVDPTEYGCVAILGGKNGINIQSSNPSPLWTPHTQGDPVPEQAMQANKVNSSRQLYFGRSQGKLCFVETKDGRLDFWRAMFDEYTKQLKGDLLMDTGFDVIEAKRGDKLPPNTLQVGGGYVGRYIGDYLCPINIHDGKVWDFQSIFKISTKKGDIVVMTNDPLL